MTWILTQIGGVSKLTFSVTYLTWPWPISWPLAVTYLPWPWPRSWPWPWPRYWPWPKIVTWILAQIEGVSKSTFSVTYLTWPWPISWHLTLNYLSRPWTWPRSWPWPKSWPWPNIVTWIFSRSRACRNWPPTWSTYRNLDLDLDLWHWPTYRDLDLDLDLDLIIMTRILAQIEGVSKSTFSVTYLSWPWPRSWPLTFMVTLTLTPVLTYITWPWAIYRDLLMATVCGRVEIDFDMNFDLLSMTLTYLIWPWPRSWPWPT